MVRFGQLGLMLAPFSPSGARTSSFLTPPPNPPCLFSRPLGGTLFAQTALSPDCPFARPPNVLFFVCLSRQTISHGPIPTRTQFDSGQVQIFRTWAEFHPQKKTTSLRHVFLCSFILPTWHRFPEFCADSLAQLLGPVPSALASPPSFFLSLNRGGV